MAKTVMVVDDSNAIRRLVCIALKDGGYDAIEAVNGREALDKATQDTVHLVICDINMPVMNGIEFVTKFKEIPKYKYTPVIMLTTESEGHVKEAGKAAGVKAWMVKPFNEAKMIVAVKRLIM